eukprot:TRINITY_DN6786_c0_g1_i1.p1 TRINITY_DN6786_c0_g1~~TRINITY_DN6786_c0_g1_i1.p1  ORF type:complete len:724 (+),score=198.04 TRINITY_DN6786_c0_g1_i1:75-2246(+)
MAKKEATVIILDIGKSMSEVVEGKPSKLESALKAVMQLIQQKILFHKNDEMGVVLVGTRETVNHLQDSGYQNITMLHDITPPTVDMLKSLEQLEPQRAEGDIIDGLIVGMDMLNRHEGKKFERRIFLVTDAGSSINAEDLPTVVDHFNKMGSKLNIIGIDFKEENDQNEDRRSEVKKENEKVLRQVAEQVEGIVVPVHEAMQMMSYFRSKTVLQRTSFRGHLEVGTELKVPFWSFVKTMELKFPALNKISAVSQQSAQPRSMGVAIERTYSIVSEPDTEVGPDDRVKGYRYGRTIVPFSKIDEESLKYETDACLKVIGFTSNKSIPRHHFMANTEMFVHDPRDPYSGPSLSALIHALAETDSVAIVRYVKRARSIPHLGFLWPHIKSDYECFFYNTLPFAEDIRQYTFASLAPERARKAFVPSQDQKNAAEELIRSLDLMKSAEDEEGNPMEALKPKHTYNPALQRFYQCVQYRALHPQAPLPKIDPQIERYVRPDAELFYKASSALDSFRDSFPLQKSEAVKEKQDRVYWKDAIAANEVKLDSYVPDPNKKRKLEGGDYVSDFTLDNLLAGGVSEVGSIRPEEDFTEMMQRRDVDLVDKAIEGMKNRIVQFVNDSVLDRLYAKSLSCLVTLRDGCMREEESDKFNSFLKEVRSLFEGKRRDDFWQLVAKKEITLISEDESPDSSISAEEAAEFLTKPQAAQVEVKIHRPSDQEIDDLLEMAE